MADLGNRTNVDTAINTLLDDAQPNEAIQPSDHNTLLKNILDTLSNGLSTTLRTNPETSGQDLEVTSGDKIKFKHSTFFGSIVSGTLTGDKTYTLPDNTGTIALLSDITSGNNIYDIDGTLAGDRIITMANRTISFSSTSGYPIIKNTATASSSGQKTLEVKANHLGAVAGCGAYIDFSSANGNYNVGRIHNYQFGTNNAGFRLFSLATDGTANLGSSFLGQDGNSALIGENVVSRISTEKVSLQGHTLIKGADTLSTSKALEIYDGDTTPNLLWDFRNNGNVHINQNSDFEIGTNFFNFTNGNKKIGIPSWNTHVRWSIDNGNGARWDLISANSSSTFNADEFGIAKGSLIPLRVFDGTRVAVGNIAKADLDTNYTLQAGDTLIGGDLHAKNGTDFSEFDFTNYPKIKIGTNTSQWWFVNSNASRSGSFDDNDLFIWDSTNSRKALQFKANGTINAPTLPTSSSGLVSGDLWNDGGTVKIV